jgi:hypothetical protein
MNNIFLKDLFNSLNSENIDYLILRGYQDLPESYSNDLDFSVRNKGELGLFFSVINTLSAKYKYSISTDAVRSGLLKVFLHFGNKILKIDVFYCFKYAGLHYIDIENLHQSKRILNTGIKAPSINYELAISLLKEILHNSRIRKDKVLLLRSQYEQAIFNIPFNNYFTEKNIIKISKSLFSGHKLYFCKLASNCRFNLVLSNLKLFGFVNTLIAMIEFFYVKYFNQKKYENIINKN